MREMEEQRPRKRKKKRKIKKNLAAAILNNKDWIP